MSAAVSSSARDLRLPSDRFYWAVLDAAPLKRRNPEQLGYLFEQVLPVPIEEIHAAYVRIDRNMYLACGMDRAKLAALAAEHEAGDALLALGPAAVPELGADPSADETGVGGKAGSINLLTGDFEPKAVRRSRRRWLLQTAAIIALFAAILALGLERRIGQLNSQAAGLQQAQRGIYEQVLGAQAVRAGGSLPPSLQLAAELRRLRQTRQSADSPESPGAGIPQLVDCAQTLASLLAIWPSEHAGQSDLFMQTDSVVITPTSVSVRGFVPSTTDAERLVGVLTVAQLAKQRPAQSGGGRWISQQPQINAGGGANSSVQVSLQWRRNEASKGATP